MTGPGASPDARSGSGALEELADLDRTGRLAGAFPRVPALLSGISGDGLQRAGRILARLGPEPVLAAHPRTPVCSIAVTGHGTVAPLVPALTAELARHGRLLRPTVGDFGGYLAELSDPGSDLHAARADLTLCLLDPQMILDEVPVPWRPADVERVLDETIARLTRLVTTFEAASVGTLVLNTLPLPRRLTGQLVDHRSRARLGAAWHEANARLLRLSGDHPGLVVFDLAPLIAGGIAAEDPRMSAYAGLYLAPGLLTAYAREVGHLAREATGGARKCLVLDLDGTLWGGVLGEDGPDGIEIGEGHRGGAFTALQRVVRQLGSQGVLLAVVSKNDPDVVHATLRDHPRLALREDDFVRVTANWRPKHDNLAALADDLGLGTDALVFVDDSLRECALVREELPGVAVVPVDGDPALHVSALLADGWFDVRELTAEDRSRGRSYREDLDRRGFLDGFDSLQDYLDRLEVRVVLAPAEQGDTARLSRLSLRTNQFNLTTRRLQPAQVGELIADPCSLVLTVRSGDRFGDNGLVGAVYARRDGGDLHIDGFMLSCRVFSRGIEQATLAALLRYAREAGAEAVIGHYRTTAKNDRVAEFYPRYGFHPAPAAETDPADPRDADRATEPTSAAFRHDLGALVEPPPHITLEADLKGHVS